MAPLMASTTRSEWLPDDPMAFEPTRLWKLPFITTWDDSRNQNHPTDFAEEACLRCSSSSLRASAVLLSRSSSRAWRSGPVFSGSGVMGIASSCCQALVRSTIAKAATHRMARERRICECMEGGNLGVLYRSARDLASPGEVRKNS